MCTIVILNQVHPRYPVIIAANRDEYYSRKASPPMLLQKSPRILAGRDDVAGGTWFGVTEDGFLVALTNQRTPHKPKADLRSRGMLVLDALKSNDSSKLCNILQTLSPKDSNPFNLVFGDSEGLKVAYGHPQSDEIVIQDLPKGRHILPNGRLNEELFFKVRHNLKRLEFLGNSPWESLSKDLNIVLSNHQKPALKNVTVPPGSSHMPTLLLQQLDAMCVHAGVYGTCSATKIALEPGRVAHYEFANGAPCRSQFREYSRLLYD
jgi:uncharacterized protein with NRDE domain